jgi:hypothetical protein
MCWLPLYGQQRRPHAVQCCRHGRLRTRIIALESHDCCAAAVYDYQVTNSEGRVFDKLVFISWWVFCLCCTVLPCCMHINSIA